jgi:osmotically-inducible protein OsmY
MAYAMKSSSTAIAMSDKDLDAAVQNKLEFDPSIDATDIAAKAKNGIVTLAGAVKSYAEKKAAEGAVKSLYGVKAVANELEVKPSSAFARSDTDIAKAVTNALEWDTLVPADRVKSVVANGSVTLSGEVEWPYQRTAAEQAVRNLFGIKAVNNNIIVKPTATPSDVKKRIEDEFRRSAVLHAQDIAVSVSGSTVTLTGKVRSWTEYDEADLAAWSVPGVTQVNNSLAVDYY